MRVIAGELRGRRLEGPAGQEVRPTADRVREALFSMLGDVSGLLVLDLYAGTGALAIEALSRGAAEATLVDTEIALAARNVEALGLASRTTLVAADAGDFLASPGPTFDLILCDPPYTLAARHEPELRDLVPKRLRVGGRVVVESSSRAGAPDVPLEIVRERQYGNSTVRIYG